MIWLKGNQNPQVKKFSNQSQDKIKQISENLNEIGDGTRKLWLYEIFYMTFFDTTIAIDDTILWTTLNMFCTQIIKHFHFA